MESGLLKKKEKNRVCLLISITWKRKMRPRDRMSFSNSCSDRIEAWYYLFLYSPAAFSNYDSDYDMNGKAARAGFQR